MHTSRTANATGSGADRHPDLETLAAFLDGKLRDAERRQVMKHLAACKDCFSLYADTARTLRELEPAGGKVLRFPFLGSPAMRRAVPLAAAAVLVAAVGLGASMWLWRPPRMDAAELVASLPDKPRWSEEIWELRMRGVDGQTPFQAQSFQLGARLVDFQLSVEAGNSSQAANAARQVANLLDGGLYPEEFRRFRQVRDALDAGAPLSPYRDLVAQVTPALEEGFWIPYTDLGKWTAAGRLSALARHPAFFERRANRRFLKLLLEDPARLDSGGETVELPGDVRGELQRVAQVWDAGPLDEQDYAAIRTSLTRVLDIYERMTEDFGT